MGSGVIFIGIPFSAAILAGGRARRLGGIDKGALTVGTLPILDRQLALLRGLTANISIVGTTRPSAANDLVMIPDLIEGAGAIGGLYTALVSAPTDAVLVIACDMPFLTAPFLTHLVTRLAGADAVVPRDTRGRHPLCASYARRIASHLKNRIETGDLRVGYALDGLDVTEIGPREIDAFDPSGRLLVNVNTPEDYERAREAAQLDAPGT
jgi:molybdopterin-guanine dinucleotide biosynthesis protein A